MHELCIEERCVQQWQCFAQKKHLVFWGEFLVVVFFKVTFLDPPPSLLLSECFAITQKTYMNMKMRWGDIGDTRSRYARVYFRADRRYSLVHARGARTNHFYNSPHDGRTRHKDMAKHCKVLTPFFIFTCVAIPSRPRFLWGSHVGQS